MVSRPGPDTGRHISKLRQKRSIGRDGDRPAENADVQSSVDGDDMPQRDWAYENRRGLLAE